MAAYICQCIIVCLSKGSKDRNVLKNWRPISLLSLVSKLASSVIAEPLKRNFDTIISKSQTGFVPGRHMSDSTKLIYDVMFHAQRENKNRLLLLIDFEKAFDSISWPFLYNILEKFGFSENFVKWVKLFYKDIKAYLSQCVFSEGLKMNMEKTKVIWIGRKCYSKEKLSVNYKLQWGNTHFSMLGLKFPTNLIKCQTKLMQEP